jgi:hypothetical protein
MRRPQDMGFEPDARYDLPPLITHEHVIDEDLAEARKAGMLFMPPALTLSEQRRVRCASVDKRVQVAGEIAAQPGPCLIWCEYNAEADACEKAITNSRQVKGADSQESKVAGLLDFADGRCRVLVTKPSIAGFGMNWQHCSRVVFLGVSHSFEQTYQAVRRCWRFGQTKPVDVHFIRGAREAPIVENYKRKEAAFHEMIDAMKQYADQAEGRSRFTAYNPTRKMRNPPWLT